MYNAPNISPIHKQVTAEEVAGLPKVLLNETLDTSGARGEGDIEQAVRTAVAQLIDDHVVYAELRYAPGVNRNVVSIERAIAAAVRGVSADERIDARLLITATRGSADVDELVDATIACTDDAVVGFALAGEDGPVVAHAAALDRLRAAFVPVTIDAGLSVGITSIAQAVVGGAVRIGHGVRIFEDFGADVEGVTTGQVSSWVRDRALCLELAPTKEISAGVVDDDAEHPLTLLEQMGFTVTVNTAQASAGGVTAEMMRLVETFDYGFDELFVLTRTAMENAFCAVPRRTEILARRILPAYEELTGAYNEDAAFADAHAQHDHEHAHDH